MFFLIYLAEVTPWLVLGLILGVLLGRLSRLQYKSFWLKVTMTAKRGFSWLDRVIFAEETMHKYHLGHAAWECPERYPTSSEKSVPEKGLQEPKLTWRRTSRLVKVDLTKMPKTKTLQPRVSISIYPPLGQIHPKARPVKVSSTRRPISKRPSDTSETKGPRRGILREDAGVDKENK